MWNVWQNTKNTTASLQSQLKATQNQITINTKNLDQLTTQNQAIQAKIQPLKDAANVLNTKLNTIKTARSLTVHNVQQIMALVPQTVTLDTVTYSDTGATLTGSAATQADVLNYAQILRDSGNFSVVVTSITYSSIVNDAGAVIDTYSFSFQIK
jgi:Tfp pilus assembly protein PilN